MSREICVSIQGFEWQRLVGMEGNSFRRIGIESLLMGGFINI